jgi:hypothetical protein
MNQIACGCAATPLKYLEPIQEIGLDNHLAEVSVLVCRECGQYWLRYLYELESFTGSGRWFLGPISKDQLSGLTAETAKNVLEGLDWYYYGGSYFKGRSGKASGTIFLGY